MNNKMCHAPCLARSHGTCYLKSEDMLDGSGVAMCQPGLPSIPRAGQEVRTARGGAFRLIGSRRRGVDGPIAFRHFVLELANRCQRFVHAGMALGPFHLLAEFVAHAIELNSFAGELSPFARHLQLGFSGGFLEFHIAGAQLFQLNVELLTVAFQLLAEFVQLGFVVGCFPGFGIFAQYAGCSGAIPR